MIQKLNPQKMYQHYELFMKHVQAPRIPKLEYFHPIQYPVVISEAKVNLRSVQDYSVLSLLILRLYDAGIRSAEAIQSISGMSLRTVETYIEKEKLMLEHIDLNTGELTEMGRLTLQANENLVGKKAQSVQYYKSVLRVHIDPITASLIPQYLELEGSVLNNIQPDEEAGDFLLPQESVATEQDFWDSLWALLNNQLTAELNDRNDIHDILKNSDTIESIIGFTPNPIRIFYRWGYLAKFKGMRYPMVLFNGRKTVANSSVSSLAAGVPEGDVVLPVAIASSDKAYLASKGISLPGVLDRRDSCFEDLRSLIRNMTLTLPDFSDIAEAEPGSEYEEEVEDEFEGEFTDEPEDEFADEFGDEFDDEFEDEFEDESADELEDEFADEFDDEFEDEFDDEFEDEFEDEEDGDDLWS